MSKVCVVVPDMFDGLLQHFADHLVAMADDSDCRKKRSNEVLYHQWYQVGDDDGWHDGPTVKCFVCGVMSFRDRVAKYRAHQTAKLINDFVKKQKKGL